VICDGSPGDSISSLFALSLPLSLPAPVTLQLDPGLGQLCVPLTAPILIGFLGTGRVGQGWAWVCEAVVQWEVQRKGLGSWQEELALEEQVVTESPGCPELGVLSNPPETKPKQWVLPVAPRPSAHSLGLHGSTPPSLPHIGEKPR
jgi:hypothetical protein